MCERARALGIRRRADPPAARQPDRRPARPRRRMRRRPPWRSASRRGSRSTTGTATSSATPTGRCPTCCARSHRAEAASPAAELEDLPPTGAEREHGGPAEPRRAADSPLLRPREQRQRADLLRRGRRADRRRARGELRRAGGGARPARAPAARRRAPPATWTPPSCTRRLAGRGLPAGRQRPRRAARHPRRRGGAAGRRRARGRGGDLAAAPAERAAGWFVIEDDAGVLSQSVDGAEERRDERERQLRRQGHFDDDGRGGVPRADPHDRRGRARAACRGRPAAGGRARRPARVAGRDRSRREPRRHRPRRRGRDRRPRRPGPRAPDRQAARGGRAAARRPARAVSA